MQKFNWWECDARRHCNRKWQSESLKYEWKNCFAFVPLDSKPNYLLGIHTKTSIFLITSRMQSIPFRRIKQQSSNPWWKNCPTWRKLEYHQKDPFFVLSLLHAILRWTEMFAFSFLRPTQRRKQILLESAARLRWTFSHTQTHIHTYARFLSISLPRAKPCGMQKF